MSASRLERDGPLRVKLKSAPGPDVELLLTVVDHEKSGRFLIVDVGVASVGWSRAVVDAASARDLAAWLREALP